MPDGGRSNLLGFLYELVVFQSIVLADDCLPTLSDGNKTLTLTGTSAHETLRNLLSEHFEARPQQFDIDLLSNNADERVLVQLKASFDLTATIAPSDLRNYLISEAQHLTNLELARGRKTVSAFVIISTMAQSPTLPPKLSEYKNDDNAARQWLMSATVPSNDVLDNAIRLLAVCTTIQLSLQHLQGRCTTTLSRLGIFSSESARVLADVTHSLASLDTPTLEELRDQFRRAIFHRNFHTFCPEALKPLLLRQVAREWETVGLTDPQLSQPLPRATLKKDILAKMQTIEQDDSKLGLILSGNGGQGKSHILRTLAKEWCNNRVVAIAPEALSAEFCLMSAFDAMFADYQIPGSATDRLSRLNLAIEACLGSAYPIWIFVPESDTMAPEELDFLLRTLSQLCDGRAKFVVTARQSNVERLVNESHNLETINVERLDQDELYSWLTTTLPSFTKSVEITSAFSQSNDNTPIPTAWRSAIVFDSVLHWHRSKTDQDLINLLMEEPACVQEFWTYARRRLCHRINKHLRDTNENIERIFCRLFEHRQTNGSISNIHRLSIYDEVAQPAASIVRQFVDVGVIERRGQDYVWALEGYVQLS